VPHRPYGQPPVYPYVPNYLAHAIVVTLLCCLPFGIPAIVYSSQVNGRLAVGDVAGAQDCSRKARKWCWVSFGMAALWFLCVFSFVGIVVNPAVSAVQQQSASFKFRSIGNDRYGDKMTAQERLKNFETERSSAACRSNLETVRSLVAAAKAADQNGRCPASLSDVGGVTESMTKCPLGDEPYIYDPSTGQVHCQHPGHEGY
jgi:hypothetical protein